MLRSLASCAFAGIIVSAAHAQTPRLSVPPDSPRWDLQGQATVAESHGRQCLLLDGGAAANYEEVYLRPHKSGLPDALQYTPVLKTGRNWQIFSGAGFTNGVDIRRTTGSICASKWPARRRSSMSKTWTDRRSSWTT